MPVSDLAKSLYLGLFYINARDLFGNPCELKSGGVFSVRRRRRRSGGIDSFVTQTTPIHRTEND